jgi:hypothetical protein
MKKTPEQRAARTSISMPLGVFTRARARVTDAGFSKFSDYVEALIRADEQRGIVAPPSRSWQKLAA